MHGKLKAPVFIIGCSRTGSKIYMNIINRSSEIHISPEISLMKPIWNRNTIYNCLKQKNNYHNTDRRIEAVRSLYKSNYYSSRLIDMGVDFETLRNEIDFNKVSVKEVFEKIISIDASNHQKKISGAKFPVHPKYFRLLLDWYPDCRIIHLTRHPLAIYYSQKNKYKKGKKNLKTNSILQALNIFYYLKHSVSAHESLKRSQQYVLMRYEDMIINTEAEMLRLHQFLNIKQMPDVTTLPVRDSSFATKGVKEKGLSTKSLTHFEKGFSSTEKKVLTILFKKYKSTFGY